MNTTPKEPTFLDPRDKIWSLYIDNAEKRDKARLEQWKGDTEGILIFTGLFAATVATFVVSSLPMLSPDSGAQTVALLSQVLVVLSNDNETSTFPLGAVTDLQAYEVPKFAIQVNALWLVSLCLSLSSALAATLVQQWARTYVHDAHRHAKLTTRGLVHAALEFGITRFHMENTTAAMMFLLHSSVFLFYSGLLVLLFSTNTVIAQVLSALLGSGGLVYFGLSLMPIFVCDTPYHTPISPLLVFLCRTFLRIYVFVIKHAEIYGYFGRALEWAEERRTQPSERGRLTFSKPILSLPRQTQLMWLRYAFRQLLQAADELYELLAFWESYTDYVQSPETDVASVQLFIRLDVDVYEWLRTLLKAVDNDGHDFSRIVVLACALARHVLDFRVTTAESARDVLRKLRFTLFAASYSVTSNIGLGAREARQIYVAQVHSEIMTMALRDRAWLEDFAYRETVMRACDALGLPSHYSVVSGEDYLVEGSVVSGFITLLTQIFAWTNMVELSTISASLKRSATWLSVVKHVHTRAIDSAGLDAVAACYIDDEKHNPARLRPESDLAKLLLMLGIENYKDLEMKKYQPNEPDTPSTFSAVRPKYRQLLTICPDLANMLHSLCVMLVERRNIMGTSPFANPAPLQAPLHLERLISTDSDSLGGESPLSPGYFSKTT